MDLDRFARIVYERRRRLGLTQQQVNDQGGPTSTTLTKIENGAWVPGNRSETFRKLDQGLGWKPGSAFKTLHGGDPVEVESGLVEYSETHFAAPTSTDAFRRKELDMRIAAEDGYVDPAVLDAYRKAGRPSLELAIGKILGGLDESAARELLAELDFETLEALYAVAIDIAPTDRDTRAAAMSDEQLRDAAGEDPVWAEYVKTKRPELAEEWGFDR